MMKSKWIHLLYSFILCAGALLLFVNADHSEDEKLQSEFEQYYKIYALNVPGNLIFAGEIVPMNDEDVKERYDRELLTNVYWQSQTLLMLKRAHRFFPLIERVLAQNNVPEDFKYLAVAESGLQNVGSPAGAVGYWQFLDKTAKMYGLEISEEVDERYHLEKSTQAACRYFKSAYAEFNNWALAAASYNMGIDGIKKQLLSQKVNNYYDLYLNTETSRYVLRTLAFKQIMEHPQQFGFRISRKQLYDMIPTIQVKVTQSIPDLAVFAQERGSNYKWLKILNPWLRKSSLTVAEGKTYYIALPKDSLVKGKMAEELWNDTLLYPANLSPDSVIR